MVLNKTFSLALYRIISTNKQDSFAIILLKYNYKNDNKKPPETSSGGNTGTATSHKGVQAGVQFK
jgi:hypothetical protein